MPVDVVYGESRNRQTAKALADQLRKTVDEGTIYLGYPVLATADERVEVDALLVSRDHGLVAFLLADSMPGDAGEWSEFVDQQNRLYAVLTSHLSRHEGLRRGRHLAATPNTATVFASQLPTRADLDEDSDGFYGAMEEIPAWVAGLPPIGEDLERNLQAALQRVTTIKPKKRRSSVSMLASRGAVMKEIEKGIANLDRWQKAAAIESPEGPQRIRGLAGSGKTVVLALKAAYWHSQHPDWRIALTFHSRSLYQQIDDLVTRFTFEHANDRPDENYLRIVHSWGSRNRAGVYSMIAVALNETPRDWAYARGKYGMDDAFQGVCQELLAIARSREVMPIFDAVLIDEAQDLPPEFFQLVYLFTKHPKRIVWGYDEFQKLSDTAMLSTDELFGKGERGQSLISLDAGPDEPRRDIVLPVCYRNTPWALAVAHGLGIGAYRTEGLLQHPDDPTLWRDIGYNVVEGELAPSSHVTLERSQSSYPDYFPKHLRTDDAIVIQSFSDEQAQDVWVAEQIRKNLSEDELEHDDILVVLPDSYRAKTRAPRLMKELYRHGIDSHLVGVNTSVDTVFRPESVALAHIYRAKGNEAPMVYAIDSQLAATTFNAVTRRNTLFTAITRSRAWVRVTGWGERMSIVSREASQVIDSNFSLKFTIPTQEEILDMRHINRERPYQEQEAVQKATEGLATYLEAVDRGEMDIRDLPLAMRTRLVTSMTVEAEIDDQ